MKKEKVVFLCLILALFLISIFLYLNREEFSKKIFDARFDFKNPYLVASDSKRNIYLVDNRSRRLTKINQKGKIDFIIEGAKRGKENLYLILDMKVDDNFIYVVNVEVDLVDGYASIYEVKRYNSSSGKYDRTLFRYIRSKEERLGREAEILIGSLQLVNDKVYYVFYKKDTGSVLYEQDVNSLEKRKVVSIEGKLAAINISGVETGSIYLTKLDGRIYRVNSSGKLEEFTYYPYLKSPWGITTDNEGNLYLTDIEKQGIFKINTETRKVEKVMDISTLKKDGYNVEKAIFRYFSRNINDGSISIVDEYNNSILNIDKEGKIKFTLNQAVFPLKMLVYRWLMWFILIFDILLFVFTLGYLYFVIMKRYVSLILKMVLVLIPIVIASIVVISFRIYDDLYRRQEESIYNNVAMIAQIASEKIDGDALERITEPRHFMGKDYNKILTQMHAIMNDNADPWNALPYSRIYRVFDGLFYITCDWSSRYGVFYPYPYATEVHKNAYYKGQIGFTRYTDFDTDLIVGVAPIKNRSGKIVGVYEVIIDGYVMDEVNKIFTRQLTLGLVVSLLIFLAISIGFILLLMLSLKKLRDAIMAVSSGKWDTTIEIKSRDEVGDLGKGFNIMAGYIRNYINEITNLNRVYFKFVPSEFLKFLGKSNILDLKLGDQVEKVMSVLFSDIRSFTSLSETMSPEENFNFINAYLRRVGPVIRQNKGFIDKYIGDAIMALFPEEPENALKAGIDMRMKLFEYNQNRIKKGYVPIDIGVGIHTGKLMLGIVGEEERMDGTVISDNVNLASRLEGLTKHYGAGIIVSENTLFNIKDYQKKYEYRFLDKVKVKGKSVPVSIFEVLEGCSEKEKELKLNTKDDLETAIKLYQEKKLEEALKLFKKIKLINPEDKTVSLYINRCENYIKFGLPEGWEGVEALSEK